MAILPFPEIGTYPANQISAITAEYLSPVVSKHDIVVRCLHSMYMASDYIDSLL